MTGLSDPLLRAVQRENVRLRSDVSRLESEVESLSVQHRTSAHRLARFEDENLELRSEIASLQSENSRLRARSPDRQSVALSLELEARKAELRELKRRSPSALDQPDSTAVRRLQSENEALERALASARRTIAVYEERQEGLRSQLQDALASARDSDLRILSEELKALNDEQALKIRTLERKLEDSTAATIELESARANGRSQIILLRSEVSELERQLRAMGAENANLAKRNRDLRSELEDVTTSLSPKSRVTNEYRTAKRVNRALVSQVADIERQLSATRDRTRQLVGQLSSPLKLQREIARLTEEHDKLLGEVTALREETVSRLLADDSGEAIGDDSPQKWKERIATVVEDNRELRRKLKSPPEVSAEEIKRENENLRKLVAEQERSNQEVKRTLSPTTRKGGSSDEEFGDLPGSDGSGITKGLRLKEEEDKVE